MPKENVIVFMISPARDRFWSVWLTPHWCGTYAGTTWEGGDLIGRSGRWTTKFESTAGDLTYVDIMDMIDRKLDQDWSIHANVYYPPLAHRPTSGKVAMRLLDEAFIAMITPDDDTQLSLCAVPLFSLAETNLPWVRGLQSRPHALGDHDVLVALLPQSEDRELGTDILSRAGCRGIVAVPLASALSGDELRVLAGLVDERVTRDELSRLADAARALV